MNTVEGLLHIKQFREDLAEREVVRCRHTRDEAEAALEHARTELSDYVAYCDREEKAKYDELCRRLVRLSELQNVNAEVTAMRGKTGDYEEKVDSANDARKEAVSALADAKKSHEFAVRKREKFSDLDARIKHERLADRERREDLEMEEVRLSPPPGFDKGTDESSSQQFENMSAGTT